VATATVTISDVRLTGTNTLYPGSLVGADPWNDADAGTYTENAASFRTATGAADGLQTAVGDLSLSVDVATLNSVTLEADLTPMNVGVTGTGYAVNVSIIHPTLGYLTNFTGATDAMTGEVMETVITGTTTLGPDDPAILTEYMLPALEAGQVTVERFANAGGGLPADYIIRCHRLVLTIDYEPGTAPEPVTVEPATRMYPRDDNRGLGSPRLYPHPKSGRVVGGYL